MTVRSSICPFACRDNTTPMMMREKDIVRERYLVVGKRFFGCFVTYIIAHALILIVVVGMMRPFQRELLIDTDNVTTRLFV